MKKTLYQITYLSEKSFNLTTICFIVAKSEKQLFNKLKKFFKENSKVNCVILHQDGSGDYFVTVGLEGTTNTWTYNVDEVTKPCL